jgi:3-hydroxyacyl-CoA dehydrogenase
MADAGGLVRPERLGAVLVLVIDAPPVNALGHGLRQALWDAIATAEADPAAAAVVLAAEGRTFPAGADIAEFGQPPRAPLLSALCDRIEACGKPVVAALHGTALGGGLELALAARGRVMARDAQAGFPEVKLGLLPGAGGTQRAPRLVGARAALDMMLGGQPIGAGAAEAMGLVDLVAEPAALVETAVALAEVLAERPAPPTCDRAEGLADHAGYAAAIAAARDRAAGAATEAPGRIVDCVEAALLLPFRQGLEFERAAFADLVGSDAARALRHIFLAERRAARALGRAAAPQRITVAGAGPEGADLAWSALAAGMAVTLADRDQEHLVPGLQRIAAAAEAAGGEAWNRLQPALAEDAGSPACEAVVLTGPFATGPVPAIAAPRAAGAALVRLGQDLRLWPGRRLAEVATGEGAKAEGAAGRAALARGLGLVPVPVRGAAGLAGPMAAALAAAARHGAARHGRAAVERALALWGQAVPGLPEGEAGSARPAEVQRRLLAALANQGLRLLGDDTARAPADIDLAMVHGLGWPGHVPGPMLWAEGRGMLVLRADLKALTAEDAALWQPAPLIDHLIREGLPLSALDQG